MFNWISLNSFYDSENLKITPRHPLVNSCRIFNLRATCRHPINPRNTTTLPIRLIEHCLIVRRTFFVSIVLTQIAITIGTKSNQINTNRSLSIPLSNYAIIIIRIFNLFSHFTRRFLCHCCCFNISKCIYFTFFDVDILKCGFLPANNTQTHTIRFFIYRYIPGFSQHKNKNYEKVLLRLIPVPVPSKTMKKKKW